MWPQHCPFCQWQMLLGGHGHLRTCLQNFSEGTILDRREYHPIRIGTRKGSFLLCKL